MEKEQFLDLIALAPLVSIDLIIARPAGQYLLGKRTNRPAQGYWFVPGGRIRKNEKLADAFARISVDELGVMLSFDDALLLGAYNHIYNDNFHGQQGINTHYVALGYKIGVQDDIAIDSDDQHSQMQWWSEAELLSSALVHENTKNYFKRS